MPRTLKVTRAQVHAARLVVERAERGIGEASAAVRAIARARPADHHLQPAVDLGEPDALFSSEVEEPTVAPGSSELEEPTVRR